VVTFYAGRTYEKSFEDEAIGAVLVDREAAVPTAVTALVRDISIANDCGMMLPPTRPTFGYILSVITRFG
jgi:hypothetical protein